MLRDNSVNPGNWQNPSSAAASPPGAPPWLVAAAAEFRLKRRVLNVVRPVRAAAFGGTLVCITLLAFLRRYSPDGQSVLLAVAVWGLPICLVVWFVASSALRRLHRTTNRIARRVYGAGMHLDDEGRVLTDNPHPILIFDPARGRAPNHASPSVIGGR